jgi:hypothetical protein
MVLLGFICWNALSPVAASRVAFCGQGLHDESQTHCWIFRWFFLGTDGHVGLGVDGVVKRRERDRGFFHVIRDLLGSCSYRVGHIDPVSDDSIC